MDLNASGIAYLTFPESNSPMSIPSSDQQPSDWRGLVASKLVEQRKALEPFLIPVSRLPPIGQKNVLGFFDEGDLRGREITEVSDADAVLEMVRSGEWSCVELVTCYIKRFVEISSRHRWTSG